MQLIPVLPLGKKEMICFVGAGGKSSLMLRLAKEYANKGKKVLITTSTKMYTWQLTNCSPLILEQDKEQLKKRLVNQLNENNILAAGQYTKNQKVIGLSKETLDNLHQTRLFDYILVEADGARGKSIKVPTAREPVVPHYCTTVMIVIGADAIGCSLTEAHVHHPHLVCQVTGQQNGEIITATTIARIVQHYIQLIAEINRNIKIIPVLNKADSISAKKLIVLANNLLSDKISRVLITHNCWQNSEVVE